jgi:hypothetical protein
MFATGIENSIPTINNGRTRVDQMDVCGHYDQWRTDFDCVEEIGIHFLRYGPPLHTSFRGPGLYDWEFADVTLADLKRRNITPIVDLCHFGVPDWIGNFQNPDFPQLFATYAGAFADRFPWVQLYTPVNEMFICAVFSAKYGWWNEQATDDRSFVTALKHIVKANVLAMIEILKRRPDAIFVQSRSRNISTPTAPPRSGPAGVNTPPLPLARSQLRPPVDSEMYEYLIDNGMTRDEYHFFLHHQAEAALHPRQRLLHDRTSIRVFADGLTNSPGEVFGYSEITRQYYERYHLPGDAHRDQPAPGPNGRRGGAMALEGMGERAQDPQRRHPHRRLHLVFADRQVDWTRRFASRTAMSIRSAFTTSTVTSAPSAARTRSSFRTGGTCCPASSLLPQSCRSYRRRNRA